jgi:hypothetical protein
MSGRTPNAPTDGLCFEMPGDEHLDHVAWDVQMSRWNFAPVIVSYPTEVGGELVCFAPPGAALGGESDLGLTMWRRATWDAEWSFTAGRPPLSVEELGISEVSADLPQDFYRWGLRETAAHVERLRAFARHRERRSDLVAAADRLEWELGSVEPEALERHCVESSIEAARSDLLESRRRSPAEVLSIKSMDWGGRFGLAKQAALLLSLYGAYRLVRPSMPIQGGGLALGQLPFQSVPELLMWAYGYGHVVLSFGVLGWVFFRRNTAFEFVRNAVVVAAGLAATPYLLFSSSPGYGRTVTEIVPASALPTMPAMHLSVALVLGCSTALLVRSPVARLLWAAYPLLALAILIASNPDGLPLAIGGGFGAAAAATVFASAIVSRARVQRATPPLPRQLPEVSLFVSRAGAVGR